METLLWFIVKHLVDFIRNKTKRLFTSSLCQDLFNSLLFFQQKRPHDTLLHACCTSRTTIGTANLTFSLLESMVLCRLNVLNSLKGALAVTASWSLGCLVPTLCLQRATWSPNSNCLVLLSIVGVTTYSRPTTIRHFQIDGLLLTVKLQITRPLESEQRIDKRQSTLEICESTVDAGHRAIKIQ